MDLLNQRHYLKGPGAACKPELFQTVFTHVVHCKRYILHHNTGIGTYTNKSELLKSFVKKILFITRYDTF